MGKFSEMDILIQESYDRGFKDGWRDAADEAQNIVVEYFKPKPKKYSKGGKTFDICLISVGLIAMIAMFIDML